MADLDSYLNAYLLEPLRLTRSWGTVRSSTDSGGLGIRRQKWQNPVTVFECTASFPDASTAAAFLGFFDGKKGGRTSFTWTCPRDSVQYTCVFASDSLSETWEGPETWQYSFTLRGVT